MPSSNQRLSKHGNRTKVVKDVKTSHRHPVIKFANEELSFKCYIITFQVGLKIERCSTSAAEFSRICRLRVVAVVRYRHGVSRDLVMLLNLVTVGSSGCSVTDPENDSAA